VRQGKDLQKEENMEVEDGCPTGDCTKIMAHIHVLSVASGWRHGCARNKVTAENLWHKYSKERD